MKTPLKALFVCLLSAGFLASCEQCKAPVVTELNEADTKWLVYNTTDTVRFTDQTNETVKYVLTDAFAERVPGEGYTFADDCIETQDTQAARVIQNVGKKWPGLATYVLRRPEKFQINLIVEGQSSFALQENNPTFPTLEINGQNYQNVYEFKKDSTASGSLKRVLFNQNQGYLQVEFYGGKKLVRKP